MNPIAKNVLDYWFGPRPLSPGQDRARGKLWFSGGADTDYDIERRFGKLVSTARAGTFDSWANDPETCLALIILLDQFPRNLYRGQKGAFASDDKALALARGIYQSGSLKNLGCSEQAFALMPYQHAEDRDIQKEGVAAYRQTEEAASDDWKAIMKSYADYAQQHSDVVQQFGRFPHRNDALGRESTAEELEYLSEGGARFGQ